MTYHEVDVVKGQTVKSVEKVKNNMKKVTLSNGDIIETEMVLMTVGRRPNIDKLNLEKIGVKLGKKREILTDKFDMTTVKNIYALGDVVDKINLTPVAIRAGRILGIRLFGK